MSKGAVHRLVGIVKLEHERDGILAYNLHPGFITTERMIQDMGAFGFDADAGAPPDVIGAAAAWLCTAPEAREKNGQWIEGQNLTARPRVCCPGGTGPPTRSACRRATGSTRSRSGQLRTVTVSVSRPERSAVPPCSPVSAPSVTISVPPTKTCATPIDSA